VLTLCREYHCTPLELDEQPMGMVLDHIACLQAEARNTQIEARRAKLRKRK
jgi:hypothetical protein